MDGIKRYASIKTRKLLQDFPVVVILGARQCGKTTLAKTMTPNWKYFDLQNPNIQQRISDDPVLFFRENSTHC